MKKLILVGLVAAGLSLASGAAIAKASGAACKFADVKTLNEHLDKHVTYPAKGKDIKAACVKELPDEFTKAERGCIVKKLKDNKEYSSADEVRTALGVKK